MGAPIRLEDLFLPEKEGSKRYIYYVVCQYDSSQNMSRGVWGLECTKSKAIDSYDDIKSIATKLKEIEGDPSLQVVVTFFQLLRMESVK